jgi:hypothetical protein
MIQRSGMKQQANRTSGQPNPLLQLSRQAVSTAGRTVALMKSKPPEAQGQYLFLEYPHKNIPESGYFRPPSADSKPIQTN